MLDINKIFPDQFYTESEIYEIAEKNYLQVADTKLPSFTILEIIECFHEDRYAGADERGPRTECDLYDDDHETLAEFRNDTIPEFDGDERLFERFD